MKKTMMLLLCLLIVVSLFATTALAAAITPTGSLESRERTQCGFLHPAMLQTDLAFT